MLVDGHQYSVAVQFISKPVICHDEYYPLLPAAAGVRVVLHLCFVMEAVAKAKTVTNNLPLLSVLVAGLLAV